MSEKIELKKTLGLFDCISLIIGIIIGSGIFISPTGIIQNVGSVGSALIIWVACGLFSILGAISYSELGCMMPRAGGEYEYLMNAFGNFPAFLFIWTFVIILIPASFALTALTFADYTLKIFFDECNAPVSARLCIAALAILFVTFVNCASIKWVNLTQHAYNVGKFAGLLFIIGAGIYCLSNKQYENFLKPFENSTTDISQYAVAFHSGLYSYSGWSYLNYVVEEIKDVNRTFPLAVGIGLSVVMVIFVLSNIAYFTLLTAKEVMDSSAVAFTFTSKLLGQYSFLASFMSLFVALSSLGYINGALFSASRTIFGAARNSHMPSVLALINIRFLTPVTSIIFMASLSLICIFIDDVLYLLYMTMLSEYIFIGATVAGLLWLRRTRPNADRPMKINLIFPIVFLFLCIFIIGMTFYVDFVMSIRCLAIISSGIPVYILFVKIEKPKFVQQNIDNFTIWIQKLTVSVFDESKVE